MIHAVGMTLYLIFGIRKRGLLVLFPKFADDPVRIFQDMAAADAISGGGRIEMTAGRDMDGSTA